MKNSSYSKEILRKKIQSIRNKITPSYQNHCAQLLPNSVTGHLLSILTHAKTIASYVPFKNELNTLTTLYNFTKTIYLPVTFDSSLVFFKWNVGEALVKNQFGIYEPGKKISGRKITISNLDVIFIPLIAIDCLGNRVGSGYGYYDRALAGNTASTITVGCCYDWQVLPAKVIAPEKHDVPLDMILTPTVAITINDQILKKVGSLIHR
ncbi:MAG: 5-formyltetrahydrofolate cyclo-ligase [Methylacidiphilales bacterium]|nr:5-formyltetrahydrofolate cyclo-ligase [Candidatus Methylacidiphilales bacterium]